VRSGPPGAGRYRSDLCPKLCPMAAGERAGAKDRGPSRPSSSEPRTAGGTRAGIRPSDRLGRRGRGATWHLASARLRACPAGRPAVSAARPARGDPSEGTRAVR